MRSYARIGRRLEKKMVAINYTGSWITWKPKKERTAELFRLLKSGEKDTTLRDKVPRGLSVGKSIQHYYGMRTRGCVLIALAECSTIQTLIIDPELGGMSVMDSENGSFYALRDFEMDEVIRRDGFPDRDSFFRYFGSVGLRIRIGWKGLKPISPLRDVLDLL